MKPVVVSECAELHKIVHSLHLQDLRVGLVPTMGALHDGHLSLVRESLKQSDFTIVSIFVNPTQFAPGEDFDKYPRTLQSDLELLETVNEKENIFVFAPTAGEMYPKNFDTFVEVGGPSKPLEGTFRPTHFRGVATVVLKLFNMTQADVAFFGQKDFQQVQVIRQFVRDLNVPIKIKMCPIRREEDGLAMSSRNRYLSPDARQRALCLSRSLRHAETLIQAGCRDRAVIEAEIRAILEHPQHKIDYIAIVNPDTLLPEEAENGNTGNVGNAENGNALNASISPTFTLPVAILLAVRVDDTRLIDNIVVGE